MLLPTRKVLLIILACLAVKCIKDSMNNPSILNHKTVLYMSALPVAEYSYPVLNSMFQNKILFKHFNVLETWSFESVT
jgi:hypothetical protein